MHASPLARLRPWSTRVGLVAVIATLAGSPPAADAAPGDIVLYASDVSRMNGAWKRVSSTTGAGGQLVMAPDQGWTAVAPLSSPRHYVEWTFTATAGTPYHVWLRLRSTRNTATNDSVWVQFSDAQTAGGSRLWRIGSTSALLVNLESCKGCGMSGWGWQDGAWWTGQTPVVRFPTSGTRTIRIQTREDGVQIDQVVLSPSAYFWTSPGTLINDTTIVPKTTNTGTMTPPEVVLYASDATRRQGNWALQADSTAAFGRRNGSADHGWKNSTSEPLIAPADYVEWTFDAVGGRRYRLWLRLRARGNSPANDSVWVQFANTVNGGGAAIYRIGTSSGLPVALENCSGCGVSGWGWQRKSWWRADTGDVYFARTGRTTIRIQTREDGILVDQVVLSPSKFASSAPGPLRDDDTLVHRDGARSLLSSSGSSAGGTTSGGTSAGPRYVVFTASTDHATLVSSYVVEMFPAGADPASSSPLRSVNIGKPTPSGGEVTVDVGSMLRVLSPGTYFATLTAVGSAGWTRSAPSNTFTR